MASDEQIGIPTLTVKIGGEELEASLADRLGNINQIAALCAAGYAGLFSMEAFSPETHATPDPTAAIATSFDYVRKQLNTAKPL